MDMCEQKLEKMKTTESNQRHEREKINKIINVSTTLHICTVTIVMVHLYTFLHPLMWVFFWSKYVK